MEYRGFVIGNKYICKGLPININFPMIENEIYECVRKKDLYDVLKGKLKPHYLCDEISITVWAEYFEPFDSIESFESNGCGCNINDKYPHKCPKCGSPAYIGLNSVDCSNCNKK